MRLGALVMLLVTAGLGAEVPVVVLPAGDTVGPLVIDRPQVLRGAPGARLVRAPGAHGPTLWIRSPGVTVENLEIVGSGDGTREDRTAVVVTGDRAVLSALVIRQAWAGVWIGANGVEVRGLRVFGLARSPFWERGEGVLATKTSALTLIDLELEACADGVYLESVTGARLSRIAVRDARYGVHLMFCHEGTAADLSVRRSVVGFMAMESSAWTVTGARFTEGYRVGSAGVRLVRTKAIRVDSVVAARNAAGFELVDARDGLVVGSQIEENAVGWAWGGDNGGTRVTGNVHRGNLVDVSASEPVIADVAGGHQHAAAGATSSAGTSLRPTFDGNFWDAWRGWDLDGDGRGDTPYRYDREAAQRLQDRPWEGILLGSPWSVLSSSLPGGEVLDGGPIASSR